MIRLRVGRLPRGVMAPLLLLLACPIAAIGLAVADEPGDDRTKQADVSDKDDEPERPKRSGPVVRSAREASGLLRRPGADSYGEAIDWSTVPPWRRTSFFGVRAKGTFFVFVVDRSGSMADGFRLTRAKQELRRSIGAMRFPQRHLIIFYNERPVTMQGGQPRSAEQRDKSATFRWLRSISAIGGTDPKGALDLAIHLEPDAIFLLSDGEFPPGTERAIALRNAQARVPIHCIDLAGGRGAPQLKAIASDSGGRYAPRK